MPVWKTSRALGRWEGSARNTNGIGCTIRLSSLANRFPLGLGVVEDAVFEPSAFPFLCSPQPRPPPPRGTWVGTLRVVRELAGHLEGRDVRSTWAWVLTLSGMNCDFRLFGSSVP